MVESQIRPNRVTDGRILLAMTQLPREQFVPASMRPLAYMDEDVLVRPATREGPGRYLLMPMVLARLIQLADIKPGELVLDIGCATGYSTAVIARLAEAVVALEEDPSLVEAASKTLSEQGVDNAAVVTGQLVQGYAEEGPYDVIFIEGGVPDVPAALFDQLKDRGRLVTVILSQEGLGKAYLYERVGSDLSRRAAFDAGAPALPGFERTKEFVF